MLPTSPDMAPTLAVDLGGTQMRAALVTDDGEVVDRRAKPTPQDADCPDALLSLVGDVLADGDAETAVIGVPGRVDHCSGRLEHAPNLPPHWPEALDERLLSGRLGVPVALANDADLVATGEARFGAGRGHADVVYLTISTGVGAGVLLDGHIVAGTRSLAERRRTQRRPADRPDHHRAAAPRASRPPAPIRVVVADLGDDADMVGAAERPDQRTTLVRHAQTEWSLTGQHTGTTDLPPDRPGTVAHASPAQPSRRRPVRPRPDQPAATSRRISGLADTAEVHHDLVEWDYGTYEGRTTADIRTDDPGWDLWRTAAGAGEQVGDRRSTGPRRVDRRVTSAAG